MWESLQAVALERDEPEIAELLPRLLEWQRWLLIHALELLPGPDKVFRFRTILLLVARQNGKTVILVYLILWRLFNDRARMVIGTAQTLDIAEEAWETVVAVAEAVPELEEEIARVRGVRRVNGKQALVLDSRERYKIAAASRRGGRGLSGGELVIMDELREHKTWDSWSAVSKTTMARHRAQVWGVSNAGDAASVVLTHLRKVALAMIEGTDAQVEDRKDVAPAVSIGLFEWSAPEGSDIWDRDAWAMANPSLNHSQLSEEAIASAAATDPEFVFRPEVMCEFVNLANAGPFPNGSWERTSVLKVQRDTSREAVYCVDLSHDRKMAAIAIAFWDTEGRRRVELAARRAGTEWVIPWLQSDSRRVPADHVTLQTRGAPASSMVAEFEIADMPLVEWQGADIARAAGLFYDALRLSVDDENIGEDAALTMTHGVQPPLDVAANTARVKTLSGGWAIDWSASPEDVAPLVAAIGANWLLMTKPAPKGPSVYETRGLIVL